ncbi:MAG: aldehyde dehydrogenase family protein [Pirellulales bacterium]|nr:aldehyde dehydrogenase family protein [Pirellulales bacterium]
MTKAMEMLIGHENCTSRSDRWVEIVNPATESVHASVPHADPQDVAHAVETARHAFDHGPWTKMMPSERGKLLYRLAELIAENTDEIALLDTQDMGKPYVHSRDHDLPTCVEFMLFFAGMCDKVRGSQIPLDPSKHVYTIREPVGVVAGILPWNFPSLLAVQKLAPSLAYGNVIILKPAEQSPRSAIRIGQLALEAGIPPGVVNVVTGYGDTGAELVGNPGVDKVSFTGSTEVGKAIMRSAGDNIQKVTLELGGKTANIICADADMDAALASTVLTSCYNTGQICTTGSRLVLHQNIHDEFVERLKAKLDLLHVGDPMDDDTKLGPLVSRGQFDKVTAYIAIGQQDYEPIVCGTRQSNLKKGYYVNPTMFDNVDPGARIATEEIFGPVLSVINFDDEDEVVRIANQTSYGLATAIWTADLSRAHRLAAQVDSGFVWVNTNNYWVPSIPYEGHRSSGIGADMGIEAVESYTKLKNVIVNLDPTPNPWGG